MAARDEFGKQLLNEVLHFLKEGGDDDAAFVLRTCEFSAGEDSSKYDLPYPVWVSLGCGRTVYDMLSQPSHPLWGPIGRAVEAIAGGNPQISHHFVRMQFPPEVQEELTAISNRYAVPTAAAPQAAPTQAGVVDDIDSTLCFVIMSFSGNSRLREAYTRAVKPAVEQLGYRCERADEQQFNGSIRDRIMSNIQRARFIIADMTEARPNCYYELGIAHALGKEVIHIAGDKNDIHFDINDFNFIVYGTAADLKKRLRERIEGTIGALAQG